MTYTKRTSMAEHQKDAIYRKTQRFCSYQERTLQEVQEKLGVWGVTDSSQVMHILQKLIEDRFLNEERYVDAFIRGKFERKKWGKRKLDAALRRKGISPTLIARSLDAITPDDYRKSLQRVAERKRQGLVGIPIAQQQQKLTRYLLQKGYESDLVSLTIREMVTSSHL